MNNEEINRAIAEHLGWRLIPCNDDGFGRATGERWLDPDGDIGLTPPDYSSDLNAMHEAEKVLFQSGHTDMLNQNYWHELWRVCGDDYFKTTTAAHATACQRAEAFLRTVGKWKENE